MNFHVIQTNMSILNTAPTNPHGNCTVCAVESARALIGGLVPAGPAPATCYSIDHEAGLDHAVMKMQILPNINQGRLTTGTRENMIWQFFQHSPPGVFVLEQSEDHVYTFVKDGGAICLVDAATNVIRPVNTIADCTVVSPPYPAGYNYLDPDPEGEEGDDLTIWRWGDLHATYQ